MLVIIVLVRTIVKLFQVIYVQVKFNLNLKGLNVN